MFNCLSLKLRIEIRSSKEEFDQKSTSDDMKKSLAASNVNVFEPDNRVIIGGEMCPPVKLLYCR